MERPSGKELFNKINQAKEAILNDAIRIIDPEVIAADAIELGYQVIQLQEVLKFILEEIGPPNYAGSHPPQQSYKSEIRGLELFAFRWISKYFGCETYLKFCLERDRIYLVSLHPHREERGE